MSNRRFCLSAITQLTFFICIGLICSSSVADDIDRKAIVDEFSPELKSLDKHSPFTLGNGQFAFTADVTGFQTFAEDYFAAGFPLETKARWAWHSKPGQYSLSVADETYKAYGRQVNFPTKMDTVAAQWLRQNPHDLPLGKISLLLDGEIIHSEKLHKINQQLNLWSGKLISRYQLDAQSVLVESAVHEQRDLIGFRIKSNLNKKSRLSWVIEFPRGYDFSVKNTPGMDWKNQAEHKTLVVKQTANLLLLQREVDDHQSQVRIAWQGQAEVQQLGAHKFSIRPVNQKSIFEFTVEYRHSKNDSLAVIDFAATKKSASNFWQSYWQQGGFVDLTRSTNPQATELQRRIILSQYLLAVQQRSTIPAQETGLTSSSWYGKFHTEMAWLQYSHWLLWNRPDYALPMLNWYQEHLHLAQAIAKERGLEGARWPKMVGPNGQESPGGNPLIIWNQPHPIYLVGILYKKSGDEKFLKEYAELIEETAQAMSSMLVWDEKNKRYNLDAPIWISQEIYTPAESRNPTFELAYWRYGLELAQVWREMQGKEKNPLWQHQIEQMAGLPVKDGKYVAMESIPDTFDNPHSREDHPSMLAPTAFFDDRHIDKKIMNNTLDAVLKTWAFDSKIWGWDYPMLAMAASRLGRKDAVDLLLMESKNNFYLHNGHCPQVGAGLPVYLPANASLLTAVAVMLERNKTTDDYAGFPRESGWVVRQQGF